MSFKLLKNCSTITESFVSNIDFIRVISLLPVDIASVDIFIKNN